VISILLQDGSRLLLETGSALLAEVPNSVNVLLQDGAAFLLETAAHLKTEGGSATPTPPGIGVLLLQDGFAALLETGAYLLLETGAAIAPDDRPTTAMLSTPYLFGPQRPRLSTDDEEDELIAIMALIAARR
jgi:hypothetical protein